MPVVYPVNNNVVGSPEAALRELMYLPFRLPRNPNRLTEDMPMELSARTDSNPALDGLRKAKEAWAGERRDG